MSTEAPLFEAASDRKAPRVWVFGEVLIDAFADASVAGGAPFNLARHLRGLGAEVSLISRVGNDAHGTQLLNEAQAAELDVSGVQIDAELPSGRVQVTVSTTGEPTYTIEAPAAWDQIEPRLPNAESADASDVPDVLALGSLALRSTKSRESVWALLRAAPRAKRFVDINLRPTGPGLAVIDSLLAEAHWLKVNEAEVATLADWLEMPREPDSFCETLHTRYGTQELIVTLGAKGCLVSVEGGAPQHIASDGPIEAVDTVGAGDGFSAAWLIARLMGHTAGEAARWANRYGASVCRHRGPMPPATERAAHFQHWRGELQAPCRT